MSVTVFMDIEELSVVERTIKQLTLIIAMQNSLSDRLALEPINEALDTAADVAEKGPAITETA